MKISLVLSTYNGARFLGAQLDSVLTQTRLPDEIICFDDASKDDTVSILTDYAKRFSELTWVIKKRESNVGWRQNFHDAILRATGDLIFLCDQDDIWLPEKIEKMANIVENNGCISFLSCLPFPQNEADKNSNIPHSRKRPKLKKCGSHFDFSYTVYPGCCICFTKDLLSTFDLFSDYGKLPHDGALWKEALFQGKAFVYEEYLIRWIRHSSSATFISGRAKEANFAQRASSAKNIKEYLDYLSSIIGNLKLSSSSMRKFQESCRFSALRYELFRNKSVKAAIILFGYASFYKRIASFFGDLYFGLFSHFDNLRDQIFGTKNGTN